jgi:hypothetical protein
MLSFCPLSAPPLSPPPIRESEPSVGLSPPLPHRPAASPNQRWPLPALSRRALSILRFRRVSRLDRTIFWITVLWVAAILFRV